MTEVNFKKLVDKGRGIKEKMDALELELGAIKKTLREEAKRLKVGYFLGVKHFCRVSPLTTTESESKEVYDLFVELKREHEFFDCCKVGVTDAKALLGESLWESVSFTRSEAYKKVSFLLKAPKKYLE